MFHQHLTVQSFLLQSSIDFLLLQSSFTPFLVIYATLWGSSLSLSLTREKIPSIFPQTIPFHHSSPQQLPHLAQWDLLVTKGTGSLRTTSTTVTLQENIIPTVFIISPTPCLKYYCPCMTGLMEMMNTLTHLCLCISYLRYIQTSYFRAV